MREPAAFVLLVCACGAAAREESRGGAPAIAAAAESPSERAPVEPTGRFDDLETRGATLARGMHEAFRSGGPCEHVVILRAERSDACLRAAFESGAPIVARLLDARGNVLAITDAPARQGVLGERGPVCVRKGDTVSAVVEPAGTDVRWMAWASGT